MSTILQKNLAKNIVENAKRKKPLNKMELVVSSGYGEVTGRKHSHIILKQKGVKEELENLGFDVESAKKVATKILKSGKEENQVRIVQEIFKVHGEYAPEKHLTLSMGDVLDQLEKYGQTPTQQRLEDK